MVGLFETYIQEIDADLGNVLASLASSAKGNGKDSKLAGRSVKMAILSTVVACQLGIAREGCNELAMAGLFHDLALYESLSPFFSGRVTRGKIVEDAIGQIAQFDRIAGRDAWYFQDGSHSGDASS